ncbi:aconitase X swivel domain-containing protein [Rhodovibrionaceae bacterium A322]
MTNGSHPGKATLTTAPSNLTLAGQPLLSGQASAELLLFDRPISFWGGIDPETGRVTDPRHPQHNACIAGKIIALPGTIGSSSSSAILLELIAQDKGPAGIILVETDAILLLGALVARELDHPTPPALLLSKDQFAQLARQSRASMQVVLSED